MTQKTPITAERLRQILHYDPLTGLWRRLVACEWVAGRGKRRAGDTVGELKPNGYVFISIDGIRYRSHRLAWFYMTGEWPPEQVDHKNNIRSDNRWENLRLADNQQNGANMRRPKSNTSGFKGVYWSKNHRKWHAMIKAGGEKKYLGFFSCPEDAHAAYLDAAKKYFGEFARGS